MFAPSLKNQIFRLAKNEYPLWINGGRFEQLAMDLRYKSSNASRRARELVNESKLERRLNESRCVEYRYIPFVPLSPQEEEAEMKEHLLQTLL